MRSVPSRYPPRSTTRPIATRLGMRPTPWTSLARISPPSSSRCHPTPEFLKVARSAGVPATCLTSAPPPPFLASLLAVPRPEQHIERHHENQDDPGDDPLPVYGDPQDDHRVPDERHEHRPQEPPEDRALAPHETGPANHRRSDRRE